MTEKQAKAEKLKSELETMLLETIGQMNVQTTDYSQETKQITIYAKDGSVFRIAVQQIN